MQKNLWQQADKYDRGQGRVRDLLLPVTQMRRHCLVLVIGLFATLNVTWAQDFEYGGVWRGVMREGENRLIMELQLPTSSRSMSRFALLGDANGRFEEPVPLPLVGLTYSSRGLNFAVPISGKIDSRTIYFQLSGDNSSLKGSAWRSASGERRLVRFVPHN